MPDQRTIDDFFREYDGTVSDVLRAILNISLDQIANGQNQSLEAGKEENKSLGISVFVGNPIISRDFLSHYKDKWLYFNTSSFNFINFRTLIEHLQEILRRTSESRNPTTDQGFGALGILSNVSGGSGFDGSFHIVDGKDVFFDIPHIGNQKTVSSSSSQYINSFLGLNDTEFFRLFDRINYGSGLYGGGTRTAFYETLMAALFSQGECYGIRLGQTIYDPQIPIGKIKIVRARLKDEARSAIFPSNLWGIFPIDSYRRVMEKRRYGMDRYITKRFDKLRNDDRFFPNGLPDIFEFKYTEITFKRNGAGIEMFVTEAPLGQQTTVTNYFIYQAERNIVH